MQVSNKDVHLPTLLTSAITVTLWRYSLNVQFSIYWILESMFISYIYYKTCPIVISYFDAEFQTLLTQYRYVRYVFWGNIETLFYLILRQHSANSASKLKTVLRKCNELKNTCYLRTLKYTHCTEILIFIFTANN